MRYLVLILMFSVLCLAGKGNYFPVSVINSKETMEKKLFRKKADCEAFYSEDCFDITSKDLAYYDANDYEVDDYSKPKYAAKKKVQSCSDAESCFGLIQTVDDVMYCASEGEGYFAIVAEDYSEVYCTKITGYDKKTIYKLEENAEKKAAKEAADLAETQAKQAKKDAKEAAKSTLASCREANADAKACVIKILDYLEL
jgi:hypothetical protein